MATKAALKTKATDIENNKPDTTGLITTPEFNRLTKISSVARIEKATKFLATKIQADNE